jgi:hypothetical protein
MKEEPEKLSAIMIEMAEHILTRPSDQVSSEAAHAALLLASVAWNREVDEAGAITAENCKVILSEFEEKDPALRSVLMLTDFDELIFILRSFKRSRYPDDKRFVLLCGTTPKGNVRVEWK